MGITRNAGSFGIQRPLFLDLAAAAIILDFVPMFQATQGHFFLSISFTGAINISQCSKLVNVHFSLQCWQISILETPGVR